MIIINHHNRDHDEGADSDDEECMTCHIFINLDTCNADFLFSQSPQFTRSQNKQFPKCKLRGHVLLAGISMCHTAGEWVNIISGTGLDFDWIMI